MKKTITICTCDRCGKEIKDDYLSTLINTKWRICKLTDEWKDIDLCQNCKMSFIKWLNEREE